MSSRLLKNVIGVQAPSLPDDDLVSAWVDMIIALIEV
jgi:hypothetical protein